MFSKDSRLRHLDKILVKLKTCFPSCATLDGNELLKIATWLEEEILNESTSSYDYERRLDIRLQGMEEDFPTTHGMQPQVHNQPQISLPNQSQEGQPQMLSQNVQNNHVSVGDQSFGSLPAAVPSMTSLTQTSVLNAAGLNMQSGIAQNIVGSLVSQDLPSNNFSNTLWEMSEWDQHFSYQEQQQQQQLLQDLLQPTQMSNAVDWSTDPQFEIEEQYWFQQQEEQQLMKQDLLQPTQMSNAVDRSTKTWAEKALAQYLILEKQDEQLMEQNILQPTQMSNVVGRSTNTQSEVAQQQQQQQHQLMNPQLVSSSMTANAQTGQNASMSSSDPTRQNAPTGLNASMNSNAPIGQNASTNSNDPTGQIKVDWKEELYQKIQDMKLIYVPHLNVIHHIISKECQQFKGNVPLEKQKLLYALERHIGFLNLPKDEIRHAMKDRLSNYEKQLIEVIRSNWPQDSVSAQQQILQPGAHPLSTQQQPQQQPQPQQQQQQPQPQQQQQQPQPQQQQQHRLMNPRFVSSSMTTNAQTGQNVSTNSNALTGQNADDWREEIYHKILCMKQNFMPYLKQIYQRTFKESEQLKHNASVLNVPQCERQKVLLDLLSGLEAHMRILNVSKDAIPPAMKGRLSEYEQTVIEVIKSNMLREPVSAQQQIQQPGSHPQQQHQHQQQQQQQQQRKRKRKKPEWEVENDEIYQKFLELNGNLMPHLIEMHEQLSMLKENVRERKVLDRLASLMKIFTSPKEDIVSAIKDILSDYERIIVKFIKSKKQQ